MDSLRPRRLKSVSLADNKRKKGDCNKSNIHVIKHFEPRQRSIFNHDSRELPYVNVQNDDDDYECGRQTTYYKPKIKSRNVNVAPKIHNNNNGLSKPIFKPSTKQFSATNRGAKKRTQQQLKSVVIDLSFANKCKDTIDEKEELYSKKSYDVIGSAYVENLKKEIEFARSNVDRDIVKELKTEISQFRRATATGVKVSIKKPKTVQSETLNVFIENHQNRVGPPTRKEKADAYTSTLDDKSLPQICKSTQYTVHPDISVTLSRLPVSPTRPSYDDVIKKKVLEIDAIMEGMPRIGTETDLQKIEDDEELLPTLPTELDSTLNLSFEDEETCVVRETTSTAGNCRPLVDDKYLTYVKEQKKHMKKLCKLVGQAEHILERVSGKLKDKEVVNTINDSNGLPQQITASSTSPILVERSIETEHAFMENVSIQVSLEEQNIIIEELKSALSDITHPDHLEKETNTEEEYIEDIVPKKENGKLPKNKLKIQIMPSIDIRRGLVTQKIPDVIITPSESLPKPTVPEKSNIIYEIVEHQSHSASSIGQNSSESELMIQPQPIKSSVLKDVNQKVLDIYKLESASNLSSRRSLKPKRNVLERSCEREDSKEQSSDESSKSVTTSSSEISKQPKFRLNLEEIEKNHDLKAFLTSFQVIQDKLSHKPDNKVDEETLSHISLDVYKTYVNPEGLKQQANGSSLQESIADSTRGDSEKCDSVGKFHKTQDQISDRKVTNQTELSSIDVDLFWDPKLNESVSGKSVPVLSESKATSSKIMENPKSSEESPLDRFNQISNGGSNEEPPPLKSIASYSLEQNGGRIIFPNDAQSLMMDPYIAEPLERPNTGLKTILNNSLTKGQEENDIQNVLIDEEYVLGRDIGIQVSVSQDTINTTSQQNGKDKKVTFCCLQRETTKENDRPINENCENKPKQDQKNPSRRIRFKNTRRRRGCNAFKTEPRSVRNFLTFEKHPVCDDVIHGQSSRNGNRTDVSVEKNKTIGKRTGHLNLVATQRQFNSGDHVKYVDNSETTNSYGSRERGEVISEGEIRCKCDASIGEIHACHCRPHETRSKIEYLKKHPRVLLKREFHDRNVEIKGQKMYNSNWISYYVSSNNHSDGAGNSDQSTSSSAESSGLIKK